eukprot:gnl/MRDRNA2_/MRDRNA2_104628_c0_seq1.p1 gnl/MRDRNA2_/MRDRNA2_104628_c0~~gnl/MRDRNA2_/MRDRNA2_104628_c0_seq1.p1  ORF type:complete len:332 (+),score=38.14 gnl/MRDRNA2_/MRDRNA2_104628_c0_seq1:54-1049(+)
MKGFNVVHLAFLLTAQLAEHVPAAAAFSQQSNFRYAAKPTLAAIQESHGMDTAVASSQHNAANEIMQLERVSAPGNRGMTPWSYGNEMWSSHRDSDGIREIGEQGPNHEAKHDRSLGRRGPRSMPYMDEVISHFPDKSWVMLGFLSGLLLCLPCICSCQAEDQQEGFNMGMVGLSISGLLVVSCVVFTKLGWTEVCWRIHLMIWGYYWWLGLLLIPCTCLGVVGFLVFCVPALCFRLYRIIFPPLSKDGGYGKDADAITEAALGGRMKHFEKRYPNASWSDLMPYGTQFLINEPQPRPGANSDNVPYLPIVPREPGDWDQYAAWNGSLSGT